MIPGEELVLLEDVWHLFVCDQVSTNVTAMVQQHAEEQVLVLLGDRPFEGSEVINRHQLIATKLQDNVVQQPLGLIRIALEPLLRVAF
ncbi:hypothetical protein D3C78_1585080 [compost metagenome]